MKSGENNESMRYRILLVFAAITAVLILFGISKIITHFIDIRYEENALKKYAAFSEKKLFVDMLIKDREDLSKNPDPARLIGITMDIGLQWYNLGEFRLAAKWWRRGLEIEPDNDIGWYNLGNAYLNLNQYPSAENAYRKSMEIASPGEIEGCIALGELYRYSYTDKKDLEPEVYLDCFKKHKDNRDLIARLAIYYRDSGDIKNAILYFDKLFSIEPTWEVSEELRNLRIKEQENQRAVSQ